MIRVVTRTRLLVPTDERGLASARAVFLSLVLLSLLASWAVAGQSPTLRTPDGHPDLQGVWNFSTATPMERPEDLEGKDTLSPEEAAAWEQQLAERRASDESENENAPLEARVGYSVRVWFETGHTLQRQRTSLIIDPPDGRIPMVSAAVEARRALRRERRQRNAHGPEDRGSFERCLVGFNSGPPMTPSAYNNNVQLFQTPDHVVILNEMVHSVRVIPLDGRDPLPDGVRLWTGDSRGYWENETLVVETTNFSASSGLALGGWISSANLHLVERFRRVDSETLEYEFTVTDPASWASPWTALVQMAKTEQPLYEYACHEGNYSMASSLSGARALDARVEDPR